MKTINLDFTTNIDKYNKISQSNKLKVRFFTRYFYSEYNCSKSQRRPGIKNETNEQNALFLSSIVLRFSKLLFSIPALDYFLSIHVSV